MDANFQILFALIRAIRGPFSCSRSAVLTLRLAAKLMSAK